jgi:hypothetical protein
MVKSAKTSEFLVPTDPNLASEFHRRLVNYINDYNRDLDNNHEVGVQLVSFGANIVFHLEDIGYWNPSLITLTGVTEQGDPVELIQHVSQISILLMKMKRNKPDDPKKPIGFASWDDFEKQKLIDKSAE